MDSQNTAITTIKNIVQYTLDQVSICSVFLFPVLHVVDLNVLSNMLLDKI